MPIMKTGLKDAVNKTHICLLIDTISLQIVRSEETAVFAGETVMRDTRHSSACLQS